MKRGPQPTGQGVTDAPREASVASDRRRRLTAPMVTDEPMDGEMFLAYVRKFLFPTLRPKTL
jgi:hypothetical protein